MRPSRIAMLLALCGCAVAPPGSPAGPGDEFLPVVQAAKTDFAREHHLRHEALNPSAGEHVREGVCHFQSVNAHHSRLKTFLACFNGVSTTFLESYVCLSRTMDQRAQPSMLLRLVHGRDGRSINV
jgi:hypothetical protein